MEVGDLVKLRQMDFCGKRKNILGVIVDKNIRSSTSDTGSGLKKEYLGTEYKVNIITNNKAAWYIDSSLELVSEGWRFSQTQRDRRASDSGG